MIGSKISMDVNQVKDEILSLRSQDKTDQEIYDILKLKYYDKQTLAYLIKSKSNKAELTKYTYFFYGLAAIVVITLVYLTVTIFTLPLNIFEVILFILLTFYVINLVYRLVQFNDSPLNASINLGLILSGYWLIRFFNSGGSWFTILASIFLFVFILLTKFFIYRRIYLVKKKISKDNAGDYILT